MCVNYTYILTNRNKPNKNEEKRRDVEDITIVTELIGRSPRIH